MSKKVTPNMEKKRSHAPQVNSTTPFQYSMQSQFNLRTEQSSAGSSSELSGKDEFAMAAKGWRSRTLQLAKSTNRLNAFMSDSIGLAARTRRRGFNRRQESLLDIESEDQNLLKFYLTPQIRSDKICLLIEESIARKMGEDEDNKDYDPIRAKLMCQALSKDIRTRVKTLNLRRSRIVCFVTIIEKFLQSIDYKMKFFVDPKTDFFANFKYENAQYYIIATVCIIYKD